MISVNNVSLQYGKRVLFDEVNVQFNEGNCYGIIGANGAGKSTFMKILSGELESNSGSVSLLSGKRMAVLKQNHFEFDEFPVLETVMMGHSEMYRIMKEKEAIYMNPDATEEEGLKAADLENEFGEMGGWTADSDAGELLSNLGIPVEDHYKTVQELSGSQKVRILLAQALFGNPDVLLLDEPTNDLDAETVMWLEEFLADFRNTVIVISHDRHFLDMVCTHTVDIDYQKVKVYTGNYSFWYESSQLALAQSQNKNKKTEAKRKEMMDFIQRFSANASKAKQATSRKKALDKLTIEDIKPSSRKYPFVHFKPEREPGNEILNIKGLSKKDASGNWLFKGVDFNINKGEKITLLSRDSNAITEFYQVVAGESSADEGSVEFGQTITLDHLPNENEKYFVGEQDLNLVDWLRQYSENKDEMFIRGFLGRMLFSGEEVHKKSSVLSGGEKVRCMLSKLMLKNPNFLLLDEPTSHLDLESIQALNNALIEFPGNLIFSSHDHQFVQTVANRVIEIGPNGMLDKLMTYDEYLTDEKTKEQRDALYN